MKELFRNINFKLLFAGNLVSEIGNSLFGVAMSFYILELTGSTVSMGVFLFVVTGTRILVSPLAGVLVDRWNRVKVIYVTDYIRGFLYILLGAFVLSGPNDTNIIISLYVITISTSIVAAFFGPAMTKVLPEIVGEDMLQAANGAQSIVGSLQSIIGVLAGAAIYYFIGIEMVIALNAVSFILSGFSEMFIKAKFTKIKTAEELAIQKGKSHSEDFFDSIKYIKERTGLFNLVGYSLVLNFAFTPLFAIGIPYLFKIDLARINAEMEYAYSNVAFSIAALVAGVTVGGMKFKSINKTLRFGIASLTVAFAFVAFTLYLASNGIVSFVTFYILFVIGMILIGIFLMVVNVPFNTGLVKIIDPDYRGRVFSTIGAIAGGAVPLSFLVGGFIIEYSNISVLGLFCVVILLYPTIGFITNKKVKMLIASIDKNNDDIANLVKEVQ